MSTGALGHQPPSTAAFWGPLTNAKMTFTNAPAARVLLSSCPRRGHQTPLRVHPPPQGHLQPSVLSTQPSSWSWGSPGGSPGDSLALGCSSAVGWPMLYIGHKVLAPFFFHLPEVCGKVREVTTYTKRCVLERSYSKENPISFTQAAQLCNLFTVPLFLWSTPEKTNVLSLNELLSIYLLLEIHRLSETEMRIYYQKCSFYVINEN